MKTTIDIPLPLLNKAKKYAAKRKVTLKYLVELGLQQVLSGQNEKSAPFKMKNGSVDGEGLQDGLEWHDWATIREMIYEGRGGRK
jgi:hypothetical protein